MAKANYAAVGRGLLRDRRFQSLSDDAVAALFKLYLGADFWGRFSADPRMLMMTTGIIYDRWDDLLRELRHFVRLYEVDGEPYGVIRQYDDPLTAAMTTGRGASEIPDPPAVDDDSTVTHDCTLESPTTAPTTDPALKSGVLLRAEQEQEQEQDTHTAPAPEPAHVASGVPRSAMSETLARGQAAGDALAGAPPPGTVSDALEPVASALLDHVAVLCHEHGELCDKGHDLAKTRTLVEVREGPTVRDLARKYPGGFAALVAVALEPGDRMRLQKGRPGCLAYLGRSIANWMPDSAPAPSGRQRESPRAVAARTPRVLGPPPTTEREPDMTEEELDALREEYGDAMFPRPTEAANG